MRKIVTVLFLLLSTSIYAQSSGYALHFEDGGSGDNNQVVYANGYNSAAVLTQVDNVTLEAWVRWNGDGPISAENQIIAYNGKTGLDGYGISIDHANGNKVSLHVANPATMFNAASLTIGVWTHVAIVRNSGNWTIYMNGNGTAAGSEVPVTPSKTLKIGNNEDFYWGFHGNIDEVRLSNVARYTGNFTPSNTPFVDDANTIVLYHFDEGSGGTTNDASSNNNDGELGRASFPNSIPTWVVGDAPLPVLVQTFAAIRDQDNVTLKWTTLPVNEQEIFTIERSLYQNWESIGYVQGEPGIDYFTYTDDISNLSDDLKSVRYRIQYTNPKGQTDYTVEREVNVQTPESMWLAQNHPNPFNPGTYITYAIHEQAHVKLTVYNCLGQLVQTPVNQLQGAGEYAILFDGSNLPGGVYFYKLETENAFINMKKMVLLK